MSEYEELLERLLKEARPYIEKEKAARVPVAGYLDQDGINHITQYRAEDRPEAKNLLDRIDAALAAGGLGGFEASKRSRRPSQ